MAWRTIKEWNDKGRMVNKGVKSRLRCPDSGDALFCYEQTIEIDYTVLFIGNNGSEFKLEYFGDST